MAFAIVPFDPHDPSGTSGDPVKVKDAGPTVQVELNWHVPLRLTPGSAQEFQDVSVEDLQDGRCSWALLVISSLCRQSPPKIKLVPPDSVGKSLDVRRSEDVDNFGGEQCDYMHSCRYKVTFLPLTPGSSATQLLAAGCDLQIRCSRRKFLGVDTTFLSDGTWVISSEDIPVGSLMYFGECPPQTPLSTTS